MSEKPEEPLEIERYSPAWRIQVIKKFFASKEVQEKLTTHGASGTQEYDSHVLSTRNPQIADIESVSYNEALNVFFIVIDGKEFISKAFHIQNGQLIDIKLWGKSKEDDPKKIAKEIGILDEILERLEEVAEGNLDETRPVILNISSKNNPVSEDSKTTKLPVAAEPAQPTSIIGKLSATAKAAIKKITPRANKDNKKE